MNKRIAIISSKRFVGKISEDLWLKEALLEQGENADIVPWDNKSIAWTDYKSAILRSCWGYHKHYSDFLKFLENLKLSNVHLLNNIDVIKWNIQKDLQFRELNSRGINTVPSYFIQDPDVDLNKFISENALSEKYDNWVIKPVVSGSGDNTFLIRLKNGGKTLKNERSICEVQSLLHQAFKDKKITGLILQPFLGGISEGEYACIFMDSELTHIAKRYPGIFDAKKEPIEVLQAPKEIKQLAQHCQEALIDISDKIRKGYRPVYSRCDIIKNKDKCFLMEAEMAEPDLLIRTISSQRKKSEVLGKLARIISERSR